MKLLVQPVDGSAPLLRAIRHARRAIQIVIFRFDLGEMEDALGAAVARGVMVHALIANTNHGGEKRLRKLEQRLLDAGVSVARAADDFLRYHGKVLIADDTLFVLGFNYTRLHIHRNRSFGIMARDVRLLKAVGDLVDYDTTRQPYDPPAPRLVISPENARDVLATLVSGARRSLDI